MRTRGRTSGGVLARLLASDVRFGIASVAPRLAALTAIATLMWLFAALSVWTRTRGVVPLTFGENLLLLWDGMAPYDPSSQTLFQFPMGWFALLSVALYITLEYPFRDMGGMGLSIICASRSRWAWWCSKCVWALLCATLCWLITVAIAAGATIATQGSWTCSVRPVIAAVLNVGDVEDIARASERLSTLMEGLLAMTPSLDVGAFMPAVLACLAAIMLVQMAVSLLSNPVFGFASGIALLFFSAFFDAWWLPGNYLMLGRSAVMTVGGMDPVFGVVLGAGVSLGAMAAGGLAFAQKDLPGSREV